MNDPEIEKHIQEKGLTAPRITPESVQKVITDEKYVLVEGTNTTICHLQIRHGFSACVSDENFDAEIGRYIARKNAVDKIWLLEGYLLYNKLLEK